MSGEWQDWDKLQSLMNDDHGVVPKSLMYASTLGYEA